MIFTGKNVNFPYLEYGNHKPVNKNRCIQHVLLSLWKHVMQVIDIDI